MRKIIFFLPPNVGGAERMTITIAKQLDRSIYDVKFVIVGRNYGEIESFIPEDYNKQLLYVFNIWTFGITKLALLMHNERPYAVFSSLMYLNARVIIAAKIIGGIKVVIRQDNMLAEASRINYFLIKHWYNYASVIITQQEEMKSELLSHFHNILPNNVVVVHNILDTKLIDSKLINSHNPYNPENINIVNVASICERKGQDILLRAFKIIYAKYKNAHLTFVGSYEKSDNFDELNEYISKNSLQDAVDFIGYTDNPYIWIKNANIFVLSSRMEGLPNALIEAMYIGKPVVATKCIPIIERIIKDGYNGYVVPVNDENKLADAIIKALSLHDFQMTYHPSSQEDITSIFNI